MKMSSDNLNFQKEREEKWNVLLLNRVSLLGRPKTKWVTLCHGACPVHCTGSTPTSIHWMPIVSPQLWQPEMFSDIANGPRGYWEGGGAESPLWITIILQRKKNVLLKTDSVFRGKRAVSWLRLCSTKQLLKFKNVFFSFFKILTQFWIVALQKNIYFSLFFFSLKATMQNNK